MGYNTYRGTPGEQIGKMLKRLDKRIYRLERQDRMTRVHPITGDDTFVGTVIRTPDGFPVFTASEQGGLETPSTIGVSVEVGLSGPLTVLQESSDGMDVPPTRVARFSFDGTHANLFEVPIRITVLAADTYEDAHTDWQLRLTYLVRNLDIVSVGGGDNQFFGTSEPVTGFSAVAPVQSISVAAPGSGLVGLQSADFFGYLSFLHDLPIDPRTTLEVDATLEFEHINGNTDPISLTSITVGTGTPLLKGAGFGKTYDIASPETIFTQVSNVSVMETNTHTA